MKRYSYNVTHSIVYSVVTLSNVFGVRSTLLMGYDKVMSNVREYFRR